MVNTQIQPPTKPPLSSQQTAIDDDETGLKYDDDDETGTPEVIKLPHSLDEILKDADKQIDRSSTQKIYDQLSSGIYLKQKKQKFWVDKNLKNCFMLYARGLAISRAGFPSTWHWSTLKDDESSETSTFEAAELLKLNMLYIEGKLETFKLSPGTTYEVVFILMIKNHSSYGWHIPVNVELRLFPDNTIQHHMEKFNEKLSGIWIEIPVGVFTTSAHLNMSNWSIEPAENISCYLYEVQRNIWKNGLVIKGVCIRPKINP